MSLYSIRRAVVHIPFDSADAAELSELLEERARVHVAAKALLRRVRDMADCADCRGLGRTVSLALCCVVPCPGCRVDSYAEFMAAVGKCGTCGAMPGTPGCCACKYVGCDEPPCEPAPATLRTGVPAPQLSQWEVCAMQGIVDRGPMPASSGSSAIFDAAWALEKRGLLQVDYTRGPAYLNMTPEGWRAWIARAR